MPAARRLIRFRRRIPHAGARPSGRIDGQPANVKQVTPDVVVAPLLGWDDARYRLGDGGGTFDGSLARPKPVPFKIGIGFATARVSTIFPQQHDIAMDVLVTDVGILNEKKRGNDFQKPN